MAFQFKCSECNAHIEVDDEYRDKQVTCPYCRKPTLATEVSGATATSGSTATGEGMPMPMAGDGHKKTTIIGWLALAFIVIGVAMSFYARSQMPALAAGIDRKTMTQQEITAEMQARISARPGLAVTAVLGPCVFPVVGVVLAIICLVRKIPPRWPAITALCILGGLMVTSYIIQQFMNSGAASGAGGP